MNDHGKRFRIWHAEAEHLADILERRGAPRLAPLVRQSHQQTLARRRDGFTFLMEIDASSVGVFRDAVAAVRAHGTR